MIKEKRRNKKKKKIIAVIFLNILALLLLAGVSAWTLFTVEKVTVKGNELYDDQMIKQSVLNDEFSWNSLYVYLKYKFCKPEPIPFVDTMEITLASFHEIQITMYEKGILGYVYMESTGQNAYFDKDGIVVEISADLVNDAVRVQGLHFDTVVLYEKLPVKDKTIFKSLLHLSHALEKYKLIPDAINVDENYDFILKYGKTKVVFGETDHLNEKVMRLGKIMPNIKGIKGTLHMEEWTDDTSDITFRKDG